jgi:hypothetical protein
MGAQFTSFEADAGLCHIRPLVDKALDEIWIAAARRLDLPVVRGGDAYVHWDGRALRVAGDEHLDADDTVAQLVLHEICHFITQGISSRDELDWGLDNTSERDHGRELSCVRLQAHLLGAYGLRGVLFPTTPVRGFFEGLGDDALGVDSLPRPRRRRASRSPWCCARRWRAARDSPARPRTR